MKFRKGIVCVCSGIVLYLCVLFKFIPQIETKNSQ